MHCFGFGARNIKQGTSLLEAKVLILMGLSGAGKSEIAGFVKMKFGWPIVSRDTIRAAMFTPCKYTESEKDAAYKALKLALVTLIKQQRSCVVDGMSFSRTGEFEAVRDLVVQNGAKYIALFCEVPISVAIDRVTFDSEQNIHIATVRNKEMVIDMKKRFRSIPREVIILDTNRPKTEIFQDVELLINQSFKTS